MEKEAFFGGEQMPPCFLNLNWDQSLDQTAQFESALSSLVSSPNSNAPPNLHHHPHAAAADSVVIRELIGRLGSICNSGEISPTSNYQSTNNSGYSTPVNSPPKLNLMPAVPGKTVGFTGADPGFADRAARLSCFGGRGFSGLQQLGKLSRASSSQSLKGPQLDNNELRQEESSVVSDRRESNGRKRKAATTTNKGRGKEGNLAPKLNDDEDSGAKRCKSAEAEPKIEQDGGDKQGKDGNNAKPPELPKQDYIHVRARRGQATDSHSLAERVRREKISERMKFLQDLVPGCNKVTGKAVMLDEIINYVQSLQRQVEFLSMKLATVNPRLDFNVDSLIPKDMHQPRGPMPPHSVFPLDATSSGFSYGSQPQMPSLQSLMANGVDTQSSVNPLDATLRRSLSMQLPHLDAFVDASSHLGAFWEDDLQSVVQMGFAQNQETVFSSQAFQGSLPTNNMKIEL